MKTYLVESFDYREDRSRIIIHTESAEKALKLAADHWADSPWQERPGFIYQVSRPDQDQPLEVNELGDLPQWTVTRGADGSYFL